MQNGGVQSVIKSIQRGVTAIAAGGNTDITVSSVNMLKTQVNYLGSHTNETTLSAANYRVSLINSTTLSFYRYIGGGGVSVSWELIEYY